MGLPFDDILQTVADRFGRPLGSSKPYKICFPLPSFSAWLLFGGDGFPFGHIIHIYGDEGSLKTTLAMEFGRIIAEIDGEILFLETEGRANESLYDKILKEKRDRLHVYSCNYLEEWTSIITEVVKRGPEKPLCLIVDSLLGCNTRNTSDFLLSKGVLEPRFSQEARTIADFLRTIKAPLSKLPICWIITNHAKYRPTGYTVHKTCLGGNEVRFHATVQFDLTKQSRDISPGSRCIYFLRIRASKNTFGPELTITVPVYFDEVVHFGWHAATTYILYSPKTEIDPEPKSSIVSEIQKLIPITSRHGGRKGELFSCDALSIQNVTAEELGQCIMQQNELLDRLCNLFSLERRWHYRPEKTWSENLSEYWDSLDGK